MTLNKPDEESSLVSSTGINQLEKVNDFVYLGAWIATTERELKERRMRLAGHINGHPELVANRLLLWEPNHGVRSRGRQAMTYVDSIRPDTDLSDTGEIGGLMANTVLWRQRIDTRTLKPP
ncbi:hypothetical protein ACHWQZ_G018795 [Mnemiopsis leidyi]